MPACHLSGRRLTAEEHTAYITHLCCVFVWEMDVAFSQALPLHASASCFRLLPLPLLPPLTLYIKQAGQTDRQDLHALSGITSTALPATPYSPPHLISRLIWSTHRVPLSIITHKITLAHLLRAPHALHCLLQTSGERIARLAPLTIIMAITRTRRLGGGSCWLLGLLMPPPAPWEGRGDRLLLSL